ncbi:MAG: TolB family protein [Chloroflexota bacterium]
MPENRSTASPLPRPRLGVVLGVVLALVLALLSACTPVAYAPTVATAPTAPVSVAAKPAVTPAAPRATPTPPPAAATAPRPTATPATTQTPAAGNDWAELALVWDRELWVATSDGKRMQKLTQDGGYSQPRWSPDGTRLVFTQGDGPKAEIGVVRADGTGRQILTKNAVADGGPAWSPDGRTLAFTRAADTNGDGKIDLRDEAEVWLMDADGANQRRLAAGRDPSWSPEGLRLAFATNGKLLDTPPYRQDNGIDLINAKGQNEWTVVKVADLPGEVNLGGFVFSPGTTMLKYPVWRPDGNTLAFTTDGHTGLVVTASAQGGNVRVLDTAYEGGFGRVFWSPAGDALAYEALPATGLGEVVVADVAGKRVGSVGGVRRSQSAADPAWSPDGTRLAFAQLEAEPFVGVVKRDGGEPSPLVWGRARWPEWRPKR